jgi:hypothetical protein
MTMSRRSAFLGTASGLVLCVTGTATAGPPPPPDSIADIITAPGATATVTASISITTDLLGTSSDTDVQIVPLAASAMVGFSPDTNANALSSIDGFVASFDDFTFNFELYCFPFIGCQQLDVSVNDLVLAQLLPACGAIDGAQVVTYNGLIVNSTGTVVVTGVANDMLLLDATDSNDLSATVSESLGNVTLNSPLVAPLMETIPPESLPDGVTAFSLTVTIDLANADMTGSLLAAGELLDVDQDMVLNICDNCPELSNTDQADVDMNSIGDVCEFPPCPADCAPDNGDGSFGNGSVNIDDLLAVINAFGSGAGPCDVAPDNGDGTFGNDAVNIDDLLTVINAFGACPV